MFDHQVLYAVRWPLEQPDLESMVRLFLSFLPMRFRRILDLNQYFRIYLIAKDDAVLGTDRHNIEIRLYFIRRRQLSDNIFLLLTINHLNPAGFVQSFCIRPLLSCIIGITLRRIRRS